MKKIIDLKFDTQDNIYSLTEDGIYKCPYNKIKFVKMKILSNTSIFSFTNLKIDQSNNIYLWSSKDGVYQCLNNNTEFNKIGGIHLDQERNFKIYLFFSQNNIYAITIKNPYNKKIYKCLVNETEFTLIDYKSKQNDNLTAESYRFTVDEIGNIYVLSKNFYNFTTIVYKYSFAENKFIQITGLPEKNGINNNVQLKIDSKNNIYVLNLYNKIYKCLVNETEFKEIMLPSNDSITSIKFDYQDNIYLLTNNDVFKCLVDEMEFKAMTIEENYQPRKIVINKNNNVYLIDIDNHIYKCSDNDMEFKLMSGWPGIPCILKFDKNNNIYAQFKNGIYKCLTDEMEFKAMKGLSRSITYTTFDTNGNIFALAKKNYPYKCATNEIEFKEIFNKQIFNNDNQFEVANRILAHDWITIKISYNTFLHMKQIYKDENQDKLQKLFYDIIIKFTQVNNTSLGGSILETDYNTAISVIINHFPEINNFFWGLSQGQGIKIVTNRIGSWDKSDNMGIFSQ